MRNKSDQAEDSVLGGGGAVPPGPPHGGHRLHVRRRLQVGRKESKITT